MTNCVKFRVTNSELFVSHNSLIELQVCQSLFTRETEIWILSRDCDDSSVVFENMQRLCIRHDHGRFAEAIEPQLWACVTSLSTCRWSRRTCMAVYFVIMFKKKRLLSCLMYTSLMKFYYQI